MSRRRVRGKRVRPPRPPLLGAGFFGAMPPGATRDVFIANVARDIEERLRREYQSDEHAARVREHIFQEALRRGLEGGRR